MEKEVTMTVSECADILNIGDQTLREGLKQNKFPFGVAIKTTENRWTFWISKKKFEEYIGRKIGA